jgi:uncharacterized protein (DUF488 family)
MGVPAASRTLDLLAALSRTADFSVGCYCADEARCHRSILRELLASRGALVLRDRPGKYTSSSTLMRAVSVHARRPRRISR